MSKPRPGSRGHKRAEPVEAAPATGPVSSATGLEVEPPREAFALRYDAGRPQVVWTRLVADLETPVSAYLKLTTPVAGHAPTPQGRSLLLESVAGGEVRGRYSVIGIAPDVVWRAHGDQAAIARITAGSGPPETFTPEPVGTLASLRALLAASAIELPAGLPPMAAGVFGYLGYETIRLVERLPAAKPDDLGVPDGVLMRPTIIVVFDGVKDEMIVVSPVRPTVGITAADAHAAATARLDSTVARLRAPLATAVDAAVQPAVTAAEPVSNTPPGRYLAMVAKAKEYIAAGDIFQVVLSQRFSAPFPLPAFALYRALRRTNPSPYLFHLDLGDFALCGSSPEVLVRVRAGEVTIRPIAGTAPRGRDAAEDAKLAAGLLADPKERAEHLMLLDLGRNDVGRVAVPGTVSVTEQFVVERYSHVMHIVSNVTGRLDPAHDAVDALMAGFPAGTVSGAPKVRAMEIIDELEVARRGAYAGCVGYFSAGGDMDTAIVLRTALVKDGMVHVQSGAGIVYDSVPESEQQECINKAKAVVRAAEAAVGIANGGRGSPGRGNGGAFSGP